MRTGKLSVNRQFYDQKKNVLPTDNDQRIAAHIRALGKEDCREALLFDPNPEGAQCFGIGQDTIAKDLDIEEGMSILEVGAGFGGLTEKMIKDAGKLVAVETSLYRAEILAERFADRDNMEIYVGLVQNMKFKDQFDRIIVHNMPECFGYQRTFRPLIDPILETLCTYLKKDGECYVVAEEDPGVTGSNGILDDLPSYFEKEKEETVLPIDADADRIKEVQRVQMDLLAKLKDICEAHGLKLFMMYGTLLGAVRHGGMIPGDDDIDMALPREDYNKLMLLAGEFDEPYFLQMPDNDDAFFGGYLKLRNKNTTAIHPELWYTDACEGIAIDIFPLDYGFKDREKEEKKRNELCFLQRMLFAYSYGFVKRFRDMPMLQWKFYKYMGKLTSKEKTVKRFNEVMEKGNPKDKVFGIYAHYQAQRGTVYLDEEWFADSEPMQYGNLVLNAPVGWNQLLERLYGPAYEHNIPWNEWKTRHGFYSVEKPYPYYKDKFTRLFRNQEKELDYILVGDMCLFPLFGRDRSWAKVIGYVQAPTDAEALGYYENKKTDDGKKDKANSDEEKTDHRDLLDRSKIIAWEDFCRQSIDERKIRVVIVAVNARKMEKQLQQIGLSDYLIYWVDRSDMLFADPSVAWKKMPLYMAIIK